MYKKLTTALVVLAIASAIIALAFGIRNDLEVGVCIALISGVICLAGFIMTSVYQAKQKGCCYNWVGLVWTNVLKILLGCYLFGLCFMFDKNNDDQAVNAFIIIQVAVVVLYLMFLVPILQPDPVDWKSEPTKAEEIKETLLVPDDIVPDTDDDATNLLTIV